ncbi:hypothetical protein GCM10008944_20670 [Cytobacillus oceanisediminis]
MPAESTAAQHELGRRVRRLRDEREESLESLAAKSRGLHWSYIGHLERTGKNITLTNLLRLASALDIDPSELVHGLRLDD